MLFLLIMVTRLFIGNILDDNNWLRLLLLLLYDWRQYYLLLLLWLLIGASLSIIAFRDCFCLDLQLELYRTMCGSKWMDWQDLESRRPWTRCHLHYQ